MKTARIVCVCTITAELYTLSDGPDKRLEKEVRALSKQAKYAEAVGKAGATAVVRGIADLLPGALGAVAGGVISGIAGAALEKFTEEETTPERPVITVRDIVPKSFTVTYNSFRKADELEITIPLALLPVPPHAIRGARIQAIVRQISDDDWANGVLPSSNVELPDFFGTLRTNDASVSESEIPLLTLPFLDLVGILSSTKVSDGKTFDETLPLTQAIAAFLVGTWGEGLPVAWVDPRGAEPKLGKYRPEIYKKQKGKKAEHEPTSQYTYLDAIVLACSDVGVVPRVVGTRLELAFAGTMYQGIDRGSDFKATLLVGQVVESMKSHHEYLGQRLQSVQVIAYDPVTHQQYTARFPKDPSVKGATTVAQNSRATVAPIVASLGQPGSQALEDSIVKIPLGPVQNPEMLPQVAEAIFHERARQRTHFTITTHSPFSNPFDDTATTADLLALRAGDNVSIGFVSDAGIPAEVRGLLGQLGQGETADLLQFYGIEKKSAIEISTAVALVPATDKLRVDEVKISGSDGGDVSIEIHLVTFTVIVSDLVAKADGVTQTDAEKKLASMTDGSLEGRRQACIQARNDIQDSDMSDKEKADALAKIDALESKLLKGN